MRLRRMERASRSVSERPPKRRSICASCSAARCSKRLSPSGVRATKTVRRSVSDGVRRQRPSASSRSTTAVALPFETRSMRESSDMVTPSGRRWSAAITSKRGRVVSWPRRRSRSVPSVRRVTPRSRTQARRRRLARGPGLIERLRAEDLHRKHSALLLRSCPAPVYRDRLTVDRVRAGPAEPERRGGDLFRTD